MDAAHHVPHDRADGPDTAKLIRGADIGAAQRSLPPCDAASPETMTAEVDAEDIGRVRITFRKTQAKRHRTVSWFWVAELADLAASTSVIARGHASAWSTIRVNRRSPGSIRRARCAENPGGALARRRVARDVVAADVHQPSSHSLAVEGGPYRVTRRDYGPDAGEQVHVCPIRGTCRKSSFPSSRDMR